MKVPAFLLGRLSSLSAKKLKGLAGLSNICTELILTVGFRFYAFPPRYSFGLFLVSAKTCQVLSSKYL